MILKLNGKEYETDAKTLAELFRETHPEGSSDGKAIAVNDEVVPSGEWEKYELSENDRVEVIQAVQGG